MGAPASPPAYNIIKARAMPASNAGARLIAPFFYFIVRRRGRPRSRVKAALHSNYRRIINDAGEARFHLLLLFT